MKHDFRVNARQALQRARAELSANNDERLRYAALELRMCIEAITYDRAQTYIQELPPEEYKTWQPQKLLTVLVEIEPLAATSGQLRFQQQSAPGEPEHPWVDLGETRVFGLRDIQRNYHKLGNFLHFPTLGQLQAGGVDLNKTREHCHAVAATLDYVLAAPIHNLDFKSLVTFDCEECQNKVRKRVQPGEGEVEASCFECKAEYFIKSTEEKDKYLSGRKTRNVTCPTPGCTHTFECPVEKIKAGGRWTCPSCSQGYGFFLGVFKTNSEHSSSI